MLPHNPVQIGTSTLVVVEKHIKDQGQPGIMTKDQITRRCCHDASTEPTSHRETVQQQSKRNLTFSFSISASFNKQQQGGPWPGKEKRRNQGLIN